MHNCIANSFFVKWISNILCLFEFTHPSTLLIIHFYLLLIDLIDLITFNLILNILISLIILVRRRHWHVFTLKIIYKLNFILSYYLPLILLNLALTLILQVIDTINSLKRLIHRSNWRRKGVLHLLIVTLFNYRITSFLTSLTYLSLNEKLLAIITIWRLRFLFMTTISKDVLLICLLSLLRTNTIRIIKLMHLVIFLRGMSWWTIDGALKSLGVFHYLILLIIIRNEVLAIMLLFTFNFLVILLYLLLNVLWPIVCTSCKLPFDWWYLVCLVLWFFTHHNSRHWVSSIHNLLIKVHKIYFCFACSSSSRTLLIKRIVFNFLLDLLLCVFNNKIIFLMSCQRRIMLHAKLIASFSFDCLVNHFVIFLLNSLSLWYWRMDSITSE